MRVVDVNKFVNMLKAAKELSAEYVYVNDDKCIVMDPSGSAAAFAEIEVEGKGEYYVGVPDKAMRKIMDAKSIEIDGDSVVFKGADFKLKARLLEEDSKPNDVFGLYDRFTGESERIDFEHAKFLSGINDVISIGGNTGKIEFTGDSIKLMPKSKEIEFEVSFSASSNDKSGRYVVANFKDLVRPIVRSMSGNMKMWIKSEEYPVVFDDGKIKGMVAPMVEEI